jgi:hypothetical protein
VRAGPEGDGAVSGIPLALGVVVAGFAVCIVMGVNRANLDRQTKVSIANM